MTSSTRKIVAGALSIAMVLTLVVGFAAVPAKADTTVTTTTTTSAVYTRDLTVGSTGADVTSLQSMLYSAGYLKVAPTGYFGSLTQAALAAWQASVGISPASGYFGPITRAYIASMTTTSTSTVAGCSAGSMFSATTGAPCTSTTSTVPGCVAGAMFSSTTGAPCTTTTSSVPGCVAGAAFSATTGASCAGSTTTTTTTTTGNGVLTVTQAAQPSSNANIQTYTDVPVYGLQLQAQLGDVSVNRLLLDVQDTVNTSPTHLENPGNFINTVKVWDGSTVLLNMPVNTTTFVQGTSSTDWYLQLSNINFVVPNGTTQNLVVSFSTNSGIDTSRTLTIKGYGASSLLYYSGNVATYQDVSGITTNQTFSAPGNTTVSLGVDASNPVSATSYVNSTSGAQGVTLLAFNTQSSSGSVTLKQVNATVNTNGATGFPTAAYLYDGSTLLSSVSLSGSASDSIAFNNLNDTINSGATNIYTVRVDVPSTATSLIASTTVTGITYETSNGNVSALSTTLTGNNQLFNQASSNLQITSTPVASIVSTTQNGSTTAIQGVFNLKVTPQPGQEVQPMASDFQVYVGSGGLGGTLYAVPSLSLTNITPSPSNSTAPLSQGTTYTFNLTAVESANALPGAGGSTAQYQFFLTRATTTVNNISGQSVTQVYATSTLSNNQSTNPVTVQK